MIVQEKLTAKITRARLVNFVKKHASNVFTLDLGCANSPYSSYFINRIGFDITSGQGVDVVGDAHNLPFEDEKFDQIFCTEVLEHLHTPERAIAEMWRVLKPGGALILTTRFLFPIHDAPDDYFRYTKYGLRHLLRDWDVVSIEEETETMETIAVLLQRIAFQTKMRANRFTKVFFFLLAKIFMRLNWLICEEYGDIRKSKKERIILTSGYYVVAKKGIK